MYVTIYVTTYVTSTSARTRDIASRLHTSTCVIVRADFCAEKDVDRPGDACLCIHTCILCRYEYIHTYIHTYMYMCIYTSIPIYIHTHTHTARREPIGFGRLVCMYSCTHACMNACFLCRQHVINASRVLREEGCMHLHLLSAQGADPQSSLAFFQVCMLVCASSSL